MSDEEHGVSGGGEGTSILGPAEELKFSSSYLNSYCVNGEGMSLSFYQLSRIREYSICYLPDFLPFAC